MKVIINGKEKEFSNATTVKELLEQFNIIPEVAVVEINMQVIPKEEYKTKEIKDGDIIEVLRFVGGG